MSQTLIRLFATLDDATQAAEAVKGIGVAQDAIAVIHDPADAGAQVHAEALRHGGALVSVSVEEDRLDPVCAVLDSQPWVEIGVRRDAYRRSGSPQETATTQEQIVHDRAR